MAFQWSLLSHSPVLFLLYRVAILLGTPTLRLCFPTSFTSRFMWKVMAFIQHTGVSR